jgi:uncharacterized membrane protein (UPF0127 family)
MAVFSSQAQAFNRTRQAYLATALAVADTHWTRLRGLLGLRSGDFRNGSGLWIVPCHGVHTLGMGFPIDVVYLDRAMTVIHVQNDLRPWRFAPVRTEAASVLELPSQTAAETRTAVGDKIEISINQVTLEDVTTSEVILENNGRVPSA